MYIFKPSIILFSVMADEENVFYKYPCQFCHYKTENKSSLIQHMVIHTGEKPYQCEICNFKTGWKKSIVRHGLLPHKIKPVVPIHDPNVKFQRYIKFKERIYQCPSSGCHFKSGNVRGMISHSVIHKEKIMKFKCPDCKEMFIQPGQCRFHRRSHLTAAEKEETKIKVLIEKSKLPKTGPFLCNICNTELLSINKWFSHYRCHFDKE